MAKLTQHQAVDNAVEGFREDLELIVANARRGVIAYLTDNLSVVDGGIARTKSNQKVLRGVAARFLREMRAAGFSDLVDTYVKSFNGQFQFFDDVLAKLGGSIGKDFRVKFGVRDENYFVAQQISIMHTIEDVAVSVAADAQRAALFSINGLRLSEVISEVAEQLEKTVSEATTIADTGISMFHRVIFDRGMRIVENDLPSVILVRYKYAGPDDVLKRPKCRLWLDKTIAGKLWTREEIDSLDNGQIPGVFQSCGGWNCRDQWLPVFKY